MLPFSSCACQHHVPKCKMFTCHHKAPYTMRQKLMVTPNVQILRSFEIWTKTMHIYKCGKNYRSRLQKLKVLMQNYFPCETSFETFFPPVAKMLCTKHRWVKTKDCVVQSSRSKFALPIPKLFKHICPHTIWCVHVYTDWTMVHCKRYLKTGWKNLPFHKKVGGAKN